MAVKDILETEIPKRLTAKPEIGKEIGAVIHFNITGDGGGAWTLEKILSKQLSAQTAAMTGKLKFKPMDMGLAMKLAKLMG
jgi:SCP-2 sterol transfer family